MTLPPVEQYRGTAAIRRYIRELSAGSRRAIVTNAALALAVATTEGLGLLLLLPLLEIAGVTADAGAAADLPREVKARLDLLGISGSAPAVLALYAAIMSARALLVRYSVIACVQLQEQFLLARRQRLYRAMLGARWERVAGQRDGALTRALTADLESAADAPSDLIALVTGSLLALVYLGVALRLSVPVTILGALGGTSLIMVLRRRRIAARRAAENVDEVTAELFATAAEHVDGLKTTKAHGAERRSEELFVTQSGTVARATQVCDRLFADARMVLDMGAVIVLAVSIYVAHDLLQLGTAAILVLLYIFARVTPRLASLQGSYQHLMLAMPPFGRVMRLIDHWEAASEREGDDGAAMRLKRAVVLEGVRYRYPEPDGQGAESDPTHRPQSIRPPALAGASLTIRAGATTAVVGPSGAGKSTLADIALGLLFPEAGRVEVDGVELTPARAQAWRQQVGYVAQETYLFNDTVRGNLLWARPDATEEQVWDALTLAAADQFVDALPDGLDTIIGERGRALSCGERQRLALARALLRSPQLLVLDEPTSSVDAENEREIQRAIESLTGRTTILVITHRLATIRGADVIHVLDRGRIVESGDFDTLVRLGGTFSALCEAQGLAPRTVTSVVMPLVERKPQPSALVPR